MIKRSSLVENKNKNSSARDRHTIIIYYLTTTAAAAAIQNPSNIIIYFRKRNKKNPSSVDRPFSRSSRTWMHARRVRNHLIYTIYFRDVPMNSEYCTTTQCYYYRYSRYTSGTWKIFKEEIGVYLSSVQKMTHIVQFINKT